METFRRIIQEAMPLGLDCVKLTGGEPLLHPDISSMLDLIRENGLELILETNGVLCSPEIAEKISGQRNPFVSISLDGSNEATHDRLRGVPGAFRKTVRAIRLLTERNVPPQIIMSLTGENIDQLEDMVALAEKLQVGSLKFNLVQPIGRGRALHDSGKTLAVEEMIRLGRKIESELLPAAGIDLIYDCPPAFKSLKSISSGPNGCTTCSIATILGVLPTAEYALCGIGSSIRQLIFGAAEKDSLHDIWLHNPVLLDIRDNLPAKLTGICSRCLMKYHCLGTCIALNYFRTGSLWSPFWFCEQAEAEGLFPATRLN